MARQLSGDGLDEAAPGRLAELDPEPFRSGHRQPYAIVDIGSNSVRLVVYDQLGRAPLPRFNEKSFCRLGDGLAETGRLADLGFRRTVLATRRFRAIAEAMGVARIDAIATEAVRRASNGPELVEAIARESGLHVRVLSGDDEARYAALGVVSAFYRPIGLVADMGGGSLELAEVQAEAIGGRSVSLPLGALPVQALLNEDPASAKRRVDRLLRDGVPAGLRGPVLYAVGGGWRAFARAQIERDGVPVRVTHGHALDRAAARRFAKRLWRMPAGKLARSPGVSARRVATLPAAALVLDRVLKLLAPERVVFSALGVREGWLYDQLPREERDLDPLVEGARLLGLHQARVPAFPPALVGWTDALFAAETPAERRLRVAVCAVSDLCWRDHRDVQAEEAFRRLLQFPFIGVEHPERVFVAAAVHARYAGDAADPCLEPAIRLLPPDRRRAALILGRALLLGYRLSGGVPAILDAARVSLEPGRVRLDVDAAARVPDSEVVIDRLRLLAEAAGAARWTITERQRPYPLPTIA